MSCEDEMYPILTFYNDSDTDVCVALVDVNHCDSALGMLFHGDIVSSEIVESGMHKDLIFHSSINYFFEIVGAANVSVVKFGEDGFGEMLWHRTFTEAELKALNFTLHYPPADD